MKMFRPSSTSPRDLNQPHDQSWDRRFLAPYLNQRFNFTGVVIDKIPYPNNRTQLIIASVYDLSNHDFDIDHVSVWLTRRQAAKLPLFKPIKFSARVHSYPTTEQIYLDDIHRYVPAQLTNYTLDQVTSITRTNHFQLQFASVLSAYCLHRLKLADTLTDSQRVSLQESLLQATNDGSREAMLAPYVKKHRRPVNRITIHQNLD